MIALILSAAALALAAAAVIVAAAHKTLQPQKVPVHVRAKNKRS